MENHRLPASIETDAAALFKREDALHAMKVTNRGIAVEWTEQSRNRHDSILSNGASRVNATDERLWRHTIWNDDPLQPTVI
jgi:hypothetical protein